MAYHPRLTMSGPIEDVPYAYHKNWYIIKNIKIFGFQNHLNFFFVRILISIRDDLLCSINPVFRIHENNMTTCFFDCASLSYSWSNNITRFSTHRYVELSFSHFTVVQSVNKITSNIVGQVICKSGMTSILKFHAF